MFFLLYSFSFDLPTILQCFVMRVLFKLKVEFILFVLLFILFVRSTRKYLNINLIPLFNHLISVIQVKNQ